MGLLTFKAPEVATIVRWLLRVVLVAFLVWLVKGRGEQEEEEEQDEAEPSSQRQRPAQNRGQQQRMPNNKNNQDFYRQAPRRTEYPQRDAYPQREVRQRRPVDRDGTLDFDAVINKMSKPKQMWETRKDGVAPQIIRHEAAADVPATSPKEVPPGERKNRKVEEASSLLKKSMLHAHERPVTWITWNRDGNLLFTCGKDKKVCVWSFPDGECLGSYEGHQGAVWACSVTADSSWLVTGGADSLVIVWDAGAGRELSRLELPGVCRFVEWANSGGGSGSERFATIHNKFASHPPSLTVFKFDGDVMEQQLRQALPCSATQARWGLDDKVLVTSQDNGELIFWQADTGAEVRRLKAHDTPINKFDFTPDRKIVATASTDMKVKVWDLGEEGSDGKMLYEAETDRPLNAVALGPLTRAAATAAEGDRPGCCAVIAAGGQDVRDVALSSSTSDQFNTLLFKLGASTLEADGTTTGHFGPVHTLAFSSDGSAMASGSEDGCVRLHLFGDAAAAATS